MSEHFRDAPDYWRDKWRVEHAKVERLRADFDMVDEARVDAEREVERLQVELREAKEREHGFIKQSDIPTRAENERLRHEVELRETARMNNEREVERLRSTSTDLTAERDQYRAEVERLRAREVGQANLMPGGVYYSNYVQALALMEENKKLRAALAEEEA